MSTKKLSSETNKLELEKQELRMLAAEKISDDYLNDKELTAFTDLDAEDFRDDLVVSKHFISK